MQMNARAKARLYALTALACVLWLGQSLYEANRDGSLSSWATWVFAACLVVVIGWTGYNAWIGLVKQSDDEQSDDAEAKGSDNAETTQETGEEQGTREEREAQAVGQTQEAQAVGQTQEDRE